MVRMICGYELRENGPYLEKVGKKKVGFLQDSISSEASRIDLRSLLRTWVQPKFGMDPNTEENTRSGRGKNDTRQASVPRPKT